jgi:hypothetical protein
MNEKKNLRTPDQVFLSLLVYFDRMSKLFEDAAGRPFVINSFNVHRLIITGYTVTSKLSNDISIDLVGCADNSLFIGWRQSLIGNKSTGNSISSPE